MSGNEKIPEGTKRCSKCGEVKALTKEYFPKRKDSPDGFRAYCSSCQLKEKRQYRKANRDKIAERKKQYYEANKEDILEKVGKYYETNKERRKEYLEANEERIKETRKKYKEANKERFKEYYKVNREDILEKQRKYERENRKQIAERRKEYYEANKEKWKKFYEANKEKIAERSRESYEANKERIHEARAESRKTKRKERTEALNTFYRENEVPEYVWHKDEFAFEEDFHKAIEWVSVNRIGLDVEHWTYLDEYGFPDIYVPKLDLIIEVKLLSSMWVRFKESVKEQAQRYQEISSTVIVSLDGEPDWWADDEISDVVPWMNPEGLFGFLAEILESDE